MRENRFYLVTQTFIDLIKDLGGKYEDNKQRPIYCCIKDKYIDGLYWAIPTSDISHRTPEQLTKFTNYMRLSKNDIRSAYYHIGHTNKQALYRISNCFPITQKYIDREYISKGKPLELKDKDEIESIKKKLFRILSYEGRFPNRLEQHITVTKNHLQSELEAEHQLNQLPILPNQLPQTPDLSGPSFT